MEHLEDLRRTVVWAAVWLAVGMLIALPLTPAVIELLKHPVRLAGRDPDAFLQVIQVAAGFSIAMRVVFWSGLLLSLPLIVLTAARFVYPGLTPPERQSVTRSLLAATVLFLLGVLLGYAECLPVAIQMMLRINTWIRVEPEFIEMADYISFSLKLLVAFGLAFELPIVVLALGALGIVSSDLLREKRRHVIVILMVVSMFLTPQDPITMLLMGVPLVALYEACIWILWTKERRRAGAA